MSLPISEIIPGFDIPEPLSRVEPLGNGHINRTLLLFCSGSRYVLQKINTEVFRQPELLMDNLARVTAHLRHRGVPSLELIPAKQDGRSWLRDEEGGFWRAYRYIERSRVCESAPTPEQAFAGARAFGEFQRVLADLPGPRLAETIPDFHHTPRRFEALELAVRQDPCDRLHRVLPELDFLRARADEAGKILELLQNRSLPERICHNDTKLNNVLLDEVTGAGVCVIDLDTVMPGAGAYDFGDLVRSAASPAAEDERDLTLVELQPELFRALAAGFLAGTGGILTRLECELLPFAGKLITMEIGCRFLTDYLNGDRYFRIARPEHNLDRARAQLKLVASIEAQFDTLRKITEELT